MNLDCKLTLTAHVVARKVGEESVLLDLKDGVYFGLDPVGAHFLELAEKGLSLQDVVLEMFAEYEVEVDVLRADIDSLVSELKERGLIELQELG